MIIMSKELELRWKTFGMDMWALWEVMEDARLLMYAGEMPKTTAPLVQDNEPLIECIAYLRREGDVFRGAAVRAGCPTFWRWEDGDLVMQGDTESMNLNAVMCVGDTIHVSHFSFRFV